MLKITALHYSSGKQPKPHSEWCFLYFLIGTDCLLTTQTASCLSTLKKLYNLTAGTAVFFFCITQQIRFRLFVLANAYPYFKYQNIQSSFDHTN